MTPGPSAIGPFSRLGAVMQIAYVPADYQQALRFWTTTMGVGPFFHMPDICFPDLRYRGSPSAPVFSASIGYWGDLQVELIEQHNDAPSIYTEWRAGGHEGVQHLCIMVDDLAEARVVAEREGMPVVQQASLGKGGEVIFVDTGGGPGTLIEVLQPRQGTDVLFGRWRDAARQWDGVDPLRSARQPRP